MAAEAVVLVGPESANPAFRRAWGLSLIVSTGSLVFLFDLGPDPSALLHNLAMMGLEPLHVDFAVISHHHGSHAGGLPYLAGKKLRVYVPPRTYPGFTRYVESLGLTPVPVDGDVHLGNTVVIGGLRGEPPEIAVVVEEEGRRILIVGCGYPGLPEILGRAVKAAGAPINIIVGGLCEEAMRGETMLLAEVLEEAGVEKIYPVLGSPRGIEALKRIVPRGAEICGVGCRVQL